MLTALLVSSCENEMKNQQPFELEVRLVFSAPISQSTNAPIMRAFGDPGITETFDFPQYAYIYLVWSEDGTVEKTHVETFPRIDLDDNLWVRDENTLEYSVPGDPVYVYTQKIFKLLDTKVRTWGRLYVAVSKEDIAPYVKGSDPKKTSPTSETDVQNLVFDNNTTAIQGCLQDIYSTPYNYNIGGKYYGEIVNFAYNESAGTGSNVAYANLLLYHVASKVDVMWNVKTDLRDDMKLTYLEAEHLYNGACLLFKPNQNEVSATKFTGGYSTVLVKATDTQPNIGTQWNGRAYFYTIPYKNNANPAKFPLQLRMLKNNDLYDEERADAEYYHLIKSTDMPSDAVYVPWVRCQMNINKVLDYSATPQEF